MFSAIVFTAGRTGSHIIMENLCMHFNVLRRYSDSASVNGIMHSHNPFIQPFNEDCVCIISNRQNTLNSMLSAMIVNKTSEIREYTNKCIEPFTVLKDDLWNSYIYHKVFYLLIDKTKFKRVVEIDYEDMLSDPKYLFSKFDIDKDIKFYGKKSPYDYYQIIKNIDEVKGWYAEFIQTQLTDETIRNVSSNLESDLQQIQIQHGTKV